MELSKLTDESLIQKFFDAKTTDQRDSVFQHLIERHKDEFGKSKKSWKAHIYAAGFLFIQKCPFLMVDYDPDIIYNRILTHLFQTLDSKRYNISQPFKPYFNSLIFKTLLNIRRNYNLKTKRHLKEDNNYVYEVTHSLDDKINDFTLGDTVASGFDLELQFEQKEFVNQFLEKCQEQLSEIAFAILVDNSLTKNLSSEQLAERFKCSSAKIASIKKKEIYPIIQKVKKEMLV